MSAPLCFIDTETDGVHPGRKPWEIALIRRDPDGTERTSWFFVDINLRTADPFGLKVGRFYDRHPVGIWLSTPVEVGEKCPNFRTDGVTDTWQAAQTVARMTHGAHIVGAVPNFDTEILATLLREHGLCPSWHYHLIDVENLAVGYLLAQHTEGAVGDEVRDLASPPWKSDELMAAIGVEPATEDERHTALGDARWAMRAYDAVMGGAA